ncbi:hypothetical protein FIBSPDRAFT_864509 [Athelia psychrophila]|uniref:Nephrocystin 3-like N-terminal domain-containing protein n=1 Tax=Athelia psychrophila TaxID=1759441 RepID=A0A166GIL8_9AGAM|nr:hypothetical protein FIBSPDRAFT_864509 [Fibularhizoctonia sp. CBS 109695]
MSRKPLGSIQIDLDKLLALGKDGLDVPLKLNPQESGTIIVRVREEEPIKDEARMAAMKDARKAVDDNLKEDGPIAVKHLNTVVTKLSVFAGVVDAAADIHPYVKLVWQTVSSVYKAIKDQLDRDKSVIELMETMEDTYTFVDELKAFPEKIELLKTIIRKILEETYECALFLKEYTGRGFSKRALTQTFSTKAPDQLSKFTKNFKDLKGSFFTGVAVQNALISHEVNNHVDKIARRQTLNLMRPVLLDPYCRAEVLPGTMESELDVINQWVNDASSAHNVFWMHGPPGSGKSALTRTVENVYLATNRLGASIFFDRTKPHESHPGNFICGLAHQLGKFDRRLGDVMVSAIEDRPTVVSQAGTQEMFTKLLSEPLRSVKDVPSAGPTVIVIDAMDECGEGAWERRELMKVLVAELATLPPAFRFIIASRPENDLRNYLTRPNILSHPLVPDSKETRHAVEAMLRHRLAEIRAENPYLNMPDDWPGEERIQALVNHAAGNFGRAQETLKSIDTHYPEVSICDFVEKNCGQDSEAGQAETL